jgi:excisionase family DNA binding protein
MEKSVADILKPLAAMFVDLVVDELAARAPHPRQTPAPAKPLPLLLDFDQAAELLGCSASSVRRLITARDLTLIKIGNLSRVATAEVQEFVRRQIKPADPTAPEQRLSA